MCNLTLTNHISIHRFVMMITISNHLEHLEEKKNFILYLSICYKSISEPKWKVVQPNSTRLETKITRVRAERFEDVHSDYAISDRLVECNRYRKLTADVGSGAICWGTGCDRRWKSAGRTRLKWYRCCRSREEAVNRDRVGVRSYLLLLVSYE